MTIESKGVTKPLDINTGDSALLILSRSEFILISAFYIAIWIRYPVLAVLGPIGLSKS